MDYPRIVKAYLRAGQKFLDNHPDSKTAKRYSSVYEWLTRDIFYPSEKQWMEEKQHLFGQPDYKSFLEDYFGIDLTL